MKIIYLLEHEHISDGENQTLNLGFYSSKNDIEKVISVLILKPGYNKFPEENFIITEIEVNYCYWKNGFISENGEDIEIE